MNETPKHRKVQVSRENFEAIQELGRLKQEGERLYKAAGLFSYGQWGTGVGAVLKSIELVIAVCESRSYDLSILVLLLLGFPAFYLLRRHCEKSAHECGMKQDSVLESLGLRDWRDCYTNFGTRGGDVTITETSNDDEDESKT